MEIVETYQNLLPQELLDDEYHPANELFSQNLRMVERQIVSVSMALKPRTVKAAKMMFAGAQNPEIAAELNVTAQTVSNWRGSQGVKRLIALLHHYQQYIDGPNRAHKLNMLWRVALDNEEYNPKTTIGAISEMNKMDMDEHTKSTGGGGAQTINIQINQQILPKGALD